VNFTSTSVRDRWGLALVLLAFGLAGWKVFTQDAPASFVVPTASAVQAAPPDFPVAAQAPPSPSDPSSGSALSGSGMAVQARFIPSTPGLAVHAASLVELNNGGLRAVWFSGSREGAGDVAIRSAVMDGASLQWGGETTLFDRLQIERGLWRYVKKLGNPVIARAPDGSLMLWMVTVSLGGWAGSSITWSRSTDEGETWSSPRRLVTSPFLNISTLVKGAPVSYADGKLGLPVYHEFVTKFAEMLRLNARGQVVDKLRIPASQKNLQPVVLVSGPATARVFMRSGTAERVMTSATTDAGHTWSAAVPTAWPNPDSALAGVVTASGVDWLALNPAPRGRESLALLAAKSGSSFDGVTPWLVESATVSSAWGGDRSPQNYQRVLAAELTAQGVKDADVSAYIASARRQLCGEALCAPEFSYPYLLAGRDGYVHLVYTWHRTRIKYVRLDARQALRPASGGRP